MVIAQETREKLIREAKFIKLSSWSSGSSADGVIGDLAEAMVKEDWPLVAELWIRETGDTDLEFLDEGWMDKIKGGWNKTKQAASKAAQGAKNAMAKAKRSASGAMDAVKSGFGANTSGTNIGGEETLDSAERQKKVEAHLKQVQQIISQVPDISAAGDDMGRATPPVDLLKDLLASGFPNKDQSAFKAGIIDIEDSYEKVVKAHQAGKIDPKTANLAIKAYRAITNHFADYRANDKGAYLNEAGEEEFNSETDGFQSKNMKSLYSNKLPIGLALVSVSALGLGAALDSDVVQTMLNNLKDPNIKGFKEAKVKVQKTIGALFEPGEGLTQAFQRLTNIPMDPSQPISNFTKKPEMMDLLIKATPMPDAASDMLKTALKQAPDMSMAEFFKKGTQFSGTGANPGDIFKIHDKNPIIQGFTEEMQQVATSTPADTLKNRGIDALKNLGPAVLKSLGIGGLVAAATSAGMRAKGKYYKGADQEKIDAMGGNDEVSSVLAGKSGSRMATLDALEKKMQYVKPAQGKQKDSQAAAAGNPQAAAAAPAPQAAAAGKPQAPAAPAPQAPAAPAPQAAAAGKPQAPAAAGKPKRAVKKSSPQQAMMSTLEKMGVLPFTSSVNKILSGKADQVAPDVAQAISQLVPLDAFTAGYGGNANNRSGAVSTKAKEWYRKNVKGKKIKRKKTKKNRHAQANASKTTAQFKESLDEIFLNESFQRKLAKTSDLSIIKKKIYERILRKTSAKLTLEQKKKLAKYISKKVNESKNRSKSLIT